MVSPLRTSPTEKTQRRLLLVDAAVNLVLGALLACYPQRLVAALGLPEVGVAFYPSILGAVLFGIGIALLVAYRGGAHGLGLDGAIAINLCGTGVLAAWLVAAPRVFTRAGRTTLWVVAVLVVGIGLVELGHRLRR
jgi:hypothetical protein